MLRRAYESDLRGGINRFRWVEYAFSATLMVLLISMYSGITGISAVIAIIGADEVPGFVCGIFVVQALFFFSFGLNQWLQYRGVSRWSDYAFGETTYLALSLGAKSALAWQIFGGSLAG